MMAAASTTDLTDEQISDLVDNWMIRPCEAYNDEYKECKSWKGRFHQYYVDGQYKDCSKWKEDAENCYKYRVDRSFAAGVAVIQNEKVRREERLGHARNNDVWEYRTSPPEDWAKPLPQELEKMKLPKLQTGSSEDSSKSRCVIS